MKSHLNLSVSCLIVWTQEQTDAESAVEQAEKVRSTGPVCVVIHVFIKAKCYAARL